MKVSKNAIWKLLGLAGVAGVAATGVLIARDQRQRAELSPEQVRSRLQERLRSAQEGDRTDPGSGPEPGPEHPEG